MTRNNRNYGWPAAIVFFAAASLACLWPVVVPWQLTTHLQTRDSALNAAIIGHFHEFMAGRVGFWSMPIFYPEPNTLCLSEPLITAGIFTWPLAKLFGITAASNLWIYFCAFAGALAMYAYLRRRGLDVVPSLWGGFVACYTPDLLFHSYGHQQLLFQAGFPLVLLATEQMATRRSRWWGFLFCATIAAQILSGFYIAVLFAVWCLFLIPASFWSAAHGHTQVMRHALTRQLPVVLPMLALLAMIFVPLVVGYSRYGKQFPQNPLPVVAWSSADWRGYLLPPTDPGANLTATGLAIMALTGPVDRKENTQFVGWVSLALLLTSPFLMFAGSRKRDHRQSAYWTAVVTLALVSLVLSIGPLTRGPHPARLPFAYLYAWVPAIRFLRAPARFAFILQWCIALMGAHVLNVIACRLRPRHAIWAVAIPFAALLASIIEFFPLAAAERLAAGPSVFAAYLRENRPGPILELPTRTDQMLVRLSQSQSPLANGYSGYAPLQREQELMYLDRNLNSPESLALLTDWGVKHLFISSEATPSQRYSVLSSGIASPIRSSEEGVLCKLTTQTQTVRDYARSARVGRIGKEIRLISDHHLTNESAFKPTGSIHWDESPGNCGLFELGTRSALEFRLLKPIEAVTCSKLKLRIRVMNWYDLTERGTLSWVSASSPDYSPMRAYQFCLPTDGKWHDIELDLGEFVPWLSSGTITKLRLYPTLLADTQLSIESMVLVPAE